MTKKLTPAKEATGKARALIARSAKNAASRNMGKSRGWQNTEQSLMGIDNLPKSFMEGAQDLFNSAYDSARGRGKGGGKSKRQRRGR